MSPRTMAPLRHHFILVALSLLFCFGFTRSLVADDESAVKHDRDLRAVYNQGVAFYRDGDLEKAAQRFAVSAASPSESVAAKSRFNMGNTLYAQALALLQQAETQQSAGQAASPGSPPAVSGVEEAIELLKSAIIQYRSSLRLQPSDVDARANIELCLLYTSPSPRDQRGSRMPSSA